MSAFRQIAPRLYGRKLFADKAYIDELERESLFKEQDVSVILEKRGNKVRYAYLKTYGKETIRILEEAKNEHKKVKEKGYTREQAFKDFNEAREEMNKYL